MNKMNKKGFTLIEMLVVIAIIAILVAIIIPVVSTATEKAAESRDAANIRAAVAEVSADGLTEGADKSKDVELTQKDANWDYVKENIAGIAMSDIPGSGTVTVSYDAETATISIAAKG